MTAGQFFEQFIEDYFAECDEHLSAIRRILLALEENAGTVPDSAALQQLVRSLHTIKGLSGMVGLASAERVAHAMEDALRTARASEKGVGARLIEVLFAGTTLMEHCIAARRTGGAAPRVEEYIADIGSSAISQPIGDGDPAGGQLDRGGEPGAVTESSALSRPVPNAQVFEFVPSPELARRGVGVDAIRMRLGSLGELMAAKPRVLPTGGVAFEFVVAVRPDAEPDEAWRADGLTWAPKTTPVDDRTTDHGSAPAASGRDSTSSSEPVSGSLFGSNVVRVDLNRIDEVMRLLGDLVVNRARLDETLQKAATNGLPTVLDSLAETNAAMERQLRGLREAVMRIRLVPVGEVFERLRFAVREIARETGKRVVLDLQGQATEIDKLVVERMLEPLLHLVRNAVSHGIESPDERRARNKPAEGVLSLRAAASGDRVVIEVEDDGAGIDVERVTTRGRSLGLLAPDETPDGALLELLCAPGFSTREEADLASGRGIGMSVVSATVRSLAGELSVHSVPGRGTRFTIELPLTLMIVDALLVEVGGQRMAVPQPVLREVLQVDATELTQFERNEVISYRGGVLPLLSLRGLFGLPEPSRRALYVLVVGNDANAAGLVVDRLVGLREIVVQPLADPLVAVRGIGGATELGDGRLSLILDAIALIRLARERREERGRPHMSIGAAADIPRVA